MNSGVEEYNSMVCGKNYKHFNILRESRGRWNENGQEMRLERSKKTKATFFLLLMYWLCF
jgi:hypothetical protein